MRMGKYNLKQKYVHINEVIEQFRFSYDQGSTSPPGSAKKVDLYPEMFTRSICISVPPFILVTENA